ncbi:MAG: SPOR domain-containing protein [Lysobacterales bacterium]|nr:MAG: SPOR domain-containing protein [Xanthomonadales bacterium]
MEKHVKERLVGAAVLMAAAIILIPEMLSGPDRNTDESGQRTGAETSLKTYTIDLNQAPGSSVAAKAVDDRAPPPEQVAPQSASGDAETPRSTNQAKPEAEDAQKPASDAPSSPAPLAAPAPTVAAAPRIESPSPARMTAQSQTPALASRPSAPTSGAWAVQLGSFAKQATAERFANELRGEGHSAFVMPVRSGAATLYRVRVGPMPDRAAAEAALRTLKAKASGAAVVAHQQ